MLSAPTRFLARCLALVALASLALMPGSMAGASLHRGDADALICALPGADIHRSSHSIGADLAELIASKSSPAPAEEGHDCPACLIGQTAMLPGPVVLKLLIAGSVSRTAPVFEVAFAHVPRGPPVGSRAPPVSLKA
jgi:hypothetical protein